MVSHYNTINWFATFLVLVYHLCHIKRKKMLLSAPSEAARQHFQTEQQKWGAKLFASAGFWATAEICILFLVQCGFALFFNKLFNTIFDTGLNYFGTLFLVPPVILALCALVKIDPLAQLDLITPSFPLTLTVAKIACVPAGCCQGMVWEQGIYNPFSRQIEFPSPLLESGVALVLFVVLFSFRKKFKKGTIFPVYLMAYSAIRFFTEFLRGEPNVLWGLKAYHFFCIVGVILGAAEYLAVLKYNASVQKKKIKKK